MSTFLFNDFVGAAVSFVANALGWLALGAIVATGFWVSGLYVSRRVLELTAVAKRDLRRVLGHQKKPPDMLVETQGRPTTRLVSVKPVG